MNKTGGILCAFAHPDDEQFSSAGALWKCVQRGIPVHVLCATRGDAGEISDPALATRETLAEVRSEELRIACAMLDFEPPHLLDYGDGKLPEVPADELRDVVVEYIRRLKPEVVLTFDANGGYGHPDHIAIHHATIAAIDVVGDDSHRPELGPGHIPAKLYATAYPRSLFAKMEQGLIDLGEPGFNLGAVQTIESSEMGTSADQLTTVVPVDDVYELRYAAMFAHRTQFGPEAMFARFPESLTRELMAIDCFRRIHPAPLREAPMPDETDLWAGLGD